MPGNSLESTYTPWKFKELTILFDGTAIACILTGVYLAIAAINIHLLLHRKKKYRVLLTYTITQLVFTMVDVALARLYNTPGRGLAIFGIENSSDLTALSTWPDVIADLALISNLWMSDAFLLYRCYVACLGNKHAIALPGLLYLGTVGSSLAWLISTSIPGSLYTTQAVRVTAICYWSMSAALNIYASCLISIRLWMYRQEVCHALGSGQGVFYLNYISMTLESALLYTVFAIVALVVFTLESPLQFVFIPALGIIQAIAPALIINRIARGISFEADESVSTGVNTIRFASPERPQTISRLPHQEMSDSSGATQAYSSFSADANMYDLDAFTRKNRREV